MNTQEPTHDSFSIEQIAAIRDALKQGRQALAKGKVNAQVFASAYIRAGGLQLPGETLDRDTRRRMESHVLATITGRVSGTKEQPRVGRAIQREVERILSEVECFKAMINPDLVGYRLVFDEHSSYSTICKRYATLDAFGLGPGVIPPHEIVVLPPSCDGARWEAVYEQN